MPNIKCSKSNGACKSTGQPDLGLHQRSGSHGTVPEKKVLPHVSQIHPSIVLLPKRVKVTKEMRFAQHCVAAASQLLTPQQTGALKDAGMQRIFAALRAPVHVNFQFKDYITKLLGADPGKLQKVSSNPEAQCPDLANVGNNNPESVASWQSASRQLHARQVHHGHLGTCSYSLMERKYMLAMLVRRSRSYFS